MAELRSFHFKDWEEEFDRQLPMQGTVKKAWEATEEKFEQRVGCRYFSSFESFKSSRTRRRKKKLAERNRNLQQKAGVPSGR